MATFNWSDSASDWLGSLMIKRKKKKVDLFGLVIILFSFL